MFQLQAKEAENDVLQKRLNDLVSSCFDLHFIQIIDKINTWNRFVACQQYLTKCQNPVVCL